MSMFCYQCQETARNLGCTVRGVCGKVEQVAVLQDALIGMLKGISAYSVPLRHAGDAAGGNALNRFVVEALFTTITNVNFDPEAIAGLARRARTWRAEMRDRAVSLGVAPGRPPVEATFEPETDTVDGWVEAGRRVGLLSFPEVGDTVRSLRHVIQFGLKGMSAYAEHAWALGFHDDAISTYVQEALAAIADESLGVDELLRWVQRTGEVGVQTMALLDKANTSTYGDPEPTDVNLGVRPGPGILVSGHDLRDLHELLEQTAGTGVNVYTHGEMLPANAYPLLKKYPHLVGNYGGSWWHQPDDFQSFNGAVLLTTNCLVPPRETYIDRLFTTNVVGWPGVPHIPDRVGDRPKDFSPVIARALACDSPASLEEGTIPIGYARAAVLGAADQVLAAIKSGAIKRFVVMGGCDGRAGSRAYFTQVAQSLPSDTVILTAGCAKYRYNKLGLGTIGGIPRVLDAGQCNDSYSLVIIAMKLTEALGVGHINELPIAFDIAWYEQKAVLVLLALLALGVKRIRLGPTLPAFVSPGVLDVLVQAYDLRPITSVDADVASILEGA